jgi:hypothetical protein
LRLTARKGTFFAGLNENSNPNIMKKSRIYLLLAVFTMIGFALGLAFEGIVGKAYAKTETPATELTLPKGSTFESVASGSARSANYEIVYVYGKKYIVFSSGSDIEVLEYDN